MTIKIRILEFIIKCSGYLNNLVETIKTFPKKIFYEIIVYIMEKFNECGKKCLKENKKFCKYNNSLIFFRKAKSFFVNYIKNIKNMNKIFLCRPYIVKKCKLQFETCEVYINDIISGAILLDDDSIKSGKKLISSGTELTKFKYNIIFGNKYEKEKNKIVLENYEKLLSDTM